MSENNIQYYLVTYPNCHACAEVKPYLEERGVPYNEIQPINLKGKKVFGELLKLVEREVDSFERDDNGLIMPILLEVNDSQLERVAQGLSIKQLFK